MALLLIDYETRSTVDLKKTGVGPYSEHPDTDVWCCAYKFDDEDSVNVWVPPEPCPERVRAHIESGNKVIAHNAQFEYNITNNVMHPRYGWPKLRHAQLVDTMAEAYAMALPGGLGEAGAAVGLDLQKDMQGHRIMLQMCKPRAEKDGKIIWWDAPEKVQRLIEYATVDVASEVELYGRLRRLSEREQRVWQLDQQINERGVYVDQDLINAALRITDIEKKRLNAKMSALTRGKVTACTQTALLTRWVKLQGVEVDSIAKAEIVDLLDRDDIPAYVKQVLSLRREANKSSTAKLQAFLNGASRDGRVRHLFQYHAATTGRWGGRKVQTQNLPRGNIKWKNIPRAIDLVMAQDVIAIDNEFGGVMSTVSTLIRPMICAAPGHKLICADFSNIEGRVLAWIAGEDWKIDAFKDFDAGTGHDLYNVAYAKSFKVPVESVTSDQRQLGKVQELALGFGGGVGAFQSMAKIYGVSVPDTKADELKLAWRDAHPKVKAFWYAIDKAAIDAVRNPGVIFSAGVKGRQIRYRVSGSFLWCRLPSGRDLCYPYPQLIKGATPWGEERDMLIYKTVDGFTKKWGAHQTWYGELVENIVQGIARDVLVDAMFRVDAWGYNVVMHVHDEIVSEEPLSSSTSLAEFQQLMAEVPSWAEGLPIAAKGWEGDRYRKD